MRPPPIPPEFVSLFAIEAHRIGIISSQMHDITLGWLGKLPSELLLLVLDILDLQSLTRLSGVSRTAKTVVRNYKPYQDLKEVAFPLVRDLSKANMLGAYSALDIDRVALRSDHCANCFQAAGHIFTPTCERVCKTCLESKMDFCMIEMSDLQKLNPFVLRLFKGASPFRYLGQDFVSVRHAMTNNRHVANRDWIIVLLDTLILRNEVEHLNGARTQFVSLLATVKPLLRLEPPVDACCRCRGCEIAHQLYLEGGLTHAKWNRMRPLHSHHPREMVSRVFTKVGFLHHLRECVGVRLVMEHI